MARAGAAVAALAVLALVGCRKPKEDRHYQRDVGVLCVGAAQSDASNAEVRVDEAVPIIVKTSGCLDACTLDRTARCSVRREANKLVVTSEISWRSKNDDPYVIDKPCSGACTVMEASCATPGLPAGTYELVLGELKASLEVPSKYTLPCIEGSGKVLVVAAAPSSPVFAASPASPAPPQTGAPPAPPPPGDGLCVTPFGTAKAGQSSLGIALTRPNPCTGASCATAKPTCTIKRKDKRLVLTSSMPVAATAKPRKPCTDDCPSLLASCRIDGLAPGLYTVESGETKKDVQVPLSREVCIP